MHMAKMVFNVNGAVSSAPLKTMRLIQMVYAIQFLAAAQEETRILVSYIRSTYFVLGV